MTSMTTQQEDELGMGPCGEKLKLSGDGASGLTIEAGTTVTGVQELKQQYMFSFELF